MDPIFSDLARASLVLLFAGSARHKLRDFSRFAAVLADYRLLPRWSVPAGALAIVSIEIGLILALLVPMTAPRAALGAAALLALYSFAIGINLARGRTQIDCGCGRDAEAQLSIGLLARNALLIVVAASAAMPTSNRSYVWFDYLTLGFGLLTLTLAWWAASRLASIPNPLRTHAASPGPLPAGPSLSLQGEKLHG